MDNLIIGAIAGAVSRTLTAPLELYKIQKQNQFLHQTTTSIIKKEGLKSLWKGNLTNIIRIVPQMSLNYSLFSKSKNYLSGTSFLTQDQVYFLSGAFSGSISIISIYPLETIRTRLSLQTNKQYYNGIFDIIKKTKIKKLYGGLKMTLLGYTPYNALHFMFYEKYLTFFKQHIDNHSGSYLLAGGFSGITSLSFTYPSDLIRRRLQLQDMSKDIPKYTGIIDVIQKILTKQGPSGLYKGLLPAYIKIFPTIAIQFWVIEYLKELRNH